MDTAHQESIVKLNTRLFVMTAWLSWFCFETLGFRPILPYLCYPQRNSFCMATSTTRNFQNTVESAELSNCSYETRLARIPEDLPLIRECRRTAFAHRAKGQLLTAEAQFCNATAVSNGNALCVIALADAQGSSGRSKNNQNAQPSIVLGTAEIRYKNDGTVAEISNVLVRSTQRGRGLGREIMSRTEKVVLNDKNKNKVEVMNLLVDTQNTPAVRLYESMGFETRGIHSLVKFVSDVTGVSLLVEMCKPLNKT